MQTLLFSRCIDVERGADAFSKARHPNATSQPGSGSPPDSEERHCCDQARDDALPGSDAGCGLHKPIYNRFIRLNRSCVLHRKFAEQEVNSGDKYRPAIRKTNFMSTGPKRDRYQGAIAKRIRSMKERANSKLYAPCNDKHCPMIIQLSEWQLSNDNRIDSKIAASPGAQ